MWYLLYVFFLYNIFISIISLCTFDSYVRKHIIYINYLLLHSFFIIKNKRS